MDGLLQIDSRYRSPSLSQVCVSCGKGFLRTEAHAVLHLHGITLTKNVRRLVTSANTGCVVCQLLVHAVKKSVGNFEILAEREPLADVIESLFSHQLVFQVKASLQEGKLGSHIFEVYFDRPHSTSLKCSAVVMRDNAASHYEHIPAKAPIETIRTWLHVCSTDHKHSCRVPRDAFLPRRLLDLDPRPGRSALRLVETNKSLESASYMALSYCWGGAQPGALLQARLDEYQAGIDILSLPRSLQDAVYVAKALGSKYLWADAYCILQDSAADKAAEIARMHDIYSNARLTIIIAGAASVNDGIPTQLLQDYSGWSIPLLLPDGNMGVFHLREAANLSGEEPIDFRAWALQERLLSPRTISFRSRGAALEWRCDSMHESDAGLLSSTHVLEKNWLFGDLLNDIRYNQKALRRLCFKWSQAVENYSKRQLTYAHDRLPAIGGIAQQFECPQLGTYGAGLWEALLPSGLTWEIIDHPQQRETTGSISGPSWSWASIAGTIRLPHSIPPMTRLCAKLLNMEVDLKDYSSPFGEVHGGRIRLEGYIRNVVVEGTKLLDERTKSRLGHASLDEPSLTERVSAHCFLITEGGHDEDAVTPTSDISQDLMSDTEGLVLIATSPGFRRIGTFRSDRSEMPLPDTMPGCWIYGETLIF